MALIGWTGDNGDPDNFLYTLLDRDAAVKGSAQNLAFWRDPHYHELMMAGQTSVDEAKRRGIYMQANAMIHDQVPVVPIVHASVPLILSSKIAGVIPRPDGIIDFQLLKPEAAK
jgi:peptide/nickel transport system substrate-binding protein